MNLAQALKAAKAKKPETEEADEIGHHLFSKTDFEDFQEPEKEDATDQPDTLAKALRKQRRGI